MRNPTFAVIALAALLAIAGGPAASAQDQIANGRVERVAAAGSLDAQVRALASRSSDPFWIGYAEPVVEGERVMCCFSSGSVSGSFIASSGTDGCCSGCRLEPGDDGPRAVTTTGSGEPIRLEGATELVVLARVEHGEVRRIRMFSPDCPLDAGGRTVYWLTGVAPEVSVEWLSGFASASESLASSAIGALAMHRSDSADRALERLVAAGQPPKVREKAAFWLGQARGRRGFETLRRLVDTDASEDFRRRAVFAISRSDQPETIDTIIGIARDDGSAKVRGEALFWLAQTAGARAMASITDAIANDPDTAVKKRAVFALSRLPNDDGVPKLIEVARTNRNPEVRKQAMFWLGQSKDPRALEFFEEILKK